MIIGLCGQAGNGKDTAADFLVKNSGFVKVAFADPMKRICQDVYGFTNSQLWGPSSERNKMDQRFPRAHGPWTSRGHCMCCNAEEPTAYHVPCYLTPRFALQQLGSEWGRTCYGNTWVEYALRAANTLLGDSSLMYTPWEGIIDRIEQTSMGEYKRDDAPAGCISGVVISDVRFRNETDAIIDGGGKVYRMMRGSGLEGAAGQHGSETEQAAIPLEVFSGLIDNREWTLGGLQQYMLGLAEQWQSEKKG